MSFHIEDFSKDSVGLINPYRLVYIAMEETSIWMGIYFQCWSGECPHSACGIVRLCISVSFIRFKSGECHPLEIRRE